MTPQTKSPVTPEEITDELVFAQLQAQGFSDTIGERRRRLVCSIEGKEGTGKTTLACTAPDPIIYIDIDVGTEGVVEKFQDGSNGGPAKRIFIKPIRVPKAADRETYDGLWSDMRTAIETAYRLKHGTVVIDTASEAWELCRLARFGKLAQVPPHLYGQVNADWREFLRLAYDSHMNTILIHKVKPVYINNARTSDVEIAGMSDVPYLVQVRLSTYKAQGDDGAQFGFRVLKCRPQQPLEGESFVGPMCSFPFLLNMVHGKEKK